MSYTYSENLAQPFIQQDHPVNRAWASQQVLGSASEFPVVQTDTYELTPENLMMNNKEDCDLIEGQLFSINSAGKNEYLESNSNSSDKSSPSVTFNNVPLTNNDINAVNNSLNQNSVFEAGLSQKEIANRRKAQNRAAQRAFRERKEMKLKELEEKLNQSENDKALLLKQLEDIKKQNIVISTENKLLLQSGPSKDGLLPNEQQQLKSKEQSSFSFPSSSEYKLPKHYYLPNQLENPDIPYEDKRLTITEVWEYLNEQYDQDLKIDQVMSKIKGLEVCHQHGPAFPLKTVDEIARKSLAGEWDE